MRSALAMRQTWLLRARRRRMKTGAGQEGFQNIV